MVKGRIEIILVKQNRLIICDYGSVIGIDPETVMKLK